MGGRDHLQPSVTGTTLTDGVRLTTLDSGVRIVSETMPAVRSVSVGYWVACGSRDERAGVAGASHFLEHLLFKGTKRRSAHDIAAAMDAVGGDLNAFTAKEYTCFYGRCLDRDLPLTVDLLGDMISSARLRSADVEGERDVVLEEIRAHEDAADDLVHSVFSDAYYGPHPLGREVLGTVESISAMTRDQVARYYRRAYAPQNLVVAAAGHLDHDRLVELVARSLEGIRETSVLRRAAGPPVHAEPGTVVRRKTTEQTHVVLGGRGLARADRRRWSAAVLNQALGGGMSSRLFQEVRERRGLVYSVYSYLDAHIDAGTFAVYAGTAPAKVPAVLDVVRGELDRTREQGLPEEELMRAKGHLAGSMLLSLEDTGSRMSRLGKNLITGTPLLSLDEVLAAVESVSAEDVRAVAADLLGGPYILALVGAVDAKQRRAAERCVAQAA